MLHDWPVMHEELFAKAGLSLERLKTFAEIVRAEGITAAAKGDANRQSQFSRQLKELEEFFGAELVKRGRGRFALTPAGKALHELSQSHFAALEELRRTCAQMPVEVSIGAGESLIQWILLPRLPELRRALHNTTFVFQNLQTEEILTRLADGRTDFGLVRQDAIGRSLKSVRLFTLEFGLFVNKKALPGRLPTNPERLLGELPLATLEGDSRVPRCLRDRARALGIRLKVQLACSSYTQTAEAVRRLGLAAVLPVIARNVLDPTEVRHIALPFLEELARPMALAWNARVAAIRPAVGNASRVLAEILRRA